MQIEFPLDDPDRLKALEASGLTSSSPNEELDRLAQIACSTIACPVALVSLVESDGQLFPGQAGLPEPVATARDTPLSHPFCQQVVTSREPLIVENAREHPALNANPAIEALDVVAYAGVPIILPGGAVAGSFCAIDTKPRKWSEADLGVLRALSAVTTLLVRSGDRLAAQTAAKDEIADGRYRLKQILDSTGEGIYGIDSLGICTFANRQCLELLGFDDTADLLGKNMHQLIHHSHADGSHYPVDDCKIFQAIETNAGVRSDDEVYWKKDGTPMPIEYRSYPVKDGGSTRAVITFVDISERIRQRQQLQEALGSAVRANRQKTRFLANMSHEIRTPMNAILGFSELLDEIVAEPKAKGYVNAIRSSGESLLSLINDILDLSKIESGKLELRPGPISVRGMVESVRLVMALQAAENHLDFTVEVDDACPDYLVLDDLRVRQILLNLIGNALKFTKQGSVSLRVWAEKLLLDSETVALRMSVADTGPGIPEKEHQAIFLPFRQVDSSESINGTGLGLSICRRLVNLMQGEIGVESVEGEGSTFWIRLDGVAVAAEPEGEEPTAEAPVNFNVLRPSRVLVVDDNQFNCELAAGYLSASHHTVASARDGREGVEKVRDWRPDVVLMDIRMPVMDGEEARRRIKEDPDLKQIPVLAVTASSLLNQAQQLRREFDGYMRKPFSRTELFRALAKVLPAVGDAIVDESLAPIDDTAVTEAPDPGRWRSLIQTLEEWEHGRVAPMLRSMVIGEVAEFAEELQRAGTDAGCAAVVTYAGKLATQAGLFEIRNLEATLRNFGRLVEPLKQHVQTLD